MRAPILLALGFWSGTFGCGYGWVRPGSSTARVGAIEDTSSEASLGRHARAALHARVGEAPEGAPEINGRVRVLPDTPVAMGGVAAMYRVVVEFDAAVELDGVTWHRQARAEASYLRGPTAAETLMARRAALKTATERSVARWWAQWSERRDR